MSQTAKQVDRNLAPNAASFTVIENLLSDDFEQRVGGCEIDEACALIGGHKLAATLDEQRSIVAEERT